MSFCRNINAFARLTIVIGGGRLKMCVYIGIAYKSVFVLQDHEDVALLILDKLEDTSVINQANVDLKM